MQRPIHNFKSLYNQKFKMEEQKILLKIVQSWKINPRPEYRGFRCADCQRYLHKAWHNFLDYGGFKTQIHFCKGCWKKNGKGGKYKAFQCDKCGRNMYKTYHIWKKQGKVLEETHLCKKCFLYSAKVH